jgi:hypothetical protein
MKLATKLAPCPCPAWPFNCMCRLYIPRRLQTDFREGDKVYIGSLENWREVSTRSKSRRELELKTKRLEVWVRLSEQNDNQESIWMDVCLNRVFIIFLCSLFLHTSILCCILILELDLRLYYFIFIYLRKSEKMNRINGVKGLSFRRRKLAWSE